MTGGVGGTRSSTTGRRQAQCGIRNDKEGALFWYWEVPDAGVIQLRRSLR
jgi:hypothetical protein